MAKSGPKEVYLLVYNSLCCLGWALVLKLAMQTLVRDIPQVSLAEALADVYSTEGLAMLLTYSQVAAVLEIVHSAIGVVRSPVMVTFMQVSSRIVALFAIINSLESQGKARRMRGFCMLMHKDNE
jgi:very-long-chain (3R)-3-hydroxyacyl-CoA dehydratase